MDKKAVKKKAKKSSKEIIIKTSASFDELIQMMATPMPKKKAAK